MKVVFALLAEQTFSTIVRDLILSTGIRANAPPSKLSDHQIEVLRARLLLPIE